MRRPSKPFRIAIAIFVVVVLIGYCAIRAVSSPSAILKHGLQISSIPRSVGNLRMESNVWTDEVRCFYFTIAPGDFQKLLAGRDFQNVTFESPHEERTMHISPPALISGHSYFQWKPRVRVA